MQLAVQAYVAWQVTVARVREHAADELGEGVISTAIAVLVMALLGLAMWQLFDRVFTSAGDNIQSNVNQIG